MFEPHDNSEVYCWLRHTLEPLYTVTAEPAPGYFSEWQYCYRITQGSTVVAEFSGDFRKLRPGELVDAASKLVDTLRRPFEQRRSETATTLPVASRLPPHRTDTTWFSSGRAAFAWLIQEHLRPRRIYVPSLICWSLVNVLENANPAVELQFYSVNRNLEPAYPNNLSSEDAILFVHYFGYEASVPESPGMLLEDNSHLPYSRLPVSNGHCFGSLRKVYRVADGGFLRGRFNPVYAPDRHMDAWLRQEAADWRDLREAENMTDRHWKIADIAGQSLATVLSQDDSEIALRRRQNESFLYDHLTVGEPIKPYGDSECPLLHNRYMSSRAERDSLRDFLMTQQIFTSIHWPAHPLLQHIQDSVDCTDAFQIEDLALSFPVAQDFGEREMTGICKACDAWQRAGATRFGYPAA
jgi:hypothetical protein